MGSWVFAQWLAEWYCYCLKISCLTRLSLPGLLAKENKLFLGFFSSLPVDVSKLSDFQCESEIHEA